MQQNWNSKNNPDQRNLFQFGRRNYTPTTFDSLYEVLQTTITNKTFYRPYNREDRFYKTCDIDYDEVYPNIYIGNGSTARQIQFLKKIGITHVLNAAEGKDFSMVDTNWAYYKNADISYLGFPLLDLPSENIYKYFQAAADFILIALNSGGKVFVNCLMGMSRSSTCVLASLMINENMSAAEAIRIIKKKRAIHPNEGFLRQLADLDNNLKRKNQRWTSPYN